MISRHQYVKNSMWTSVATVGLLVGSTQVAAQDATSQPAGIEDENPVVAVGSETETVITVTASRLQETGFTAPTPTQVVSEDALLQSGADNIGDVLLELPAFRASVNPQSNGVRTITPGAVFGDLRGLGASRTLVLVDGNRYVPQIYTALDGYQVDLTQIPPLMVERIEVVTGGASAQWGSDAVAGVVNVILKKDFQGFNFDVQGGISDRGDNESYRVAALAGTNFADGRGNITVALEQSENEGVGDVYTRGWGSLGPQIIGNPDFPGNGLPQNIIAQDIRFASTAPGGLIINTGLRGTTFDQNGQPIPFIYGQLPGGGFSGSMIGGGSNKGINLNTGLTIRPEGRRRNAYARGQFEFTPGVTAYTELTYTTTYGSNQSLPARDFAIPIYQDNPFLPDSVLDYMVANDLPVVLLGRAHYDLNQQLSDVRNRTYRLVGGLEGKFGDSWAWDAAVIHGDNRYRQKVFNNRNRQTFALAQDAVRDPATGRIVCRSTLTDPDNGCIPLNLFGPNSISADAADYVTGTTMTETSYSQTVVNANLAGQPFSTWAGPISIALGAEYREEEQLTIVDPIADLALWESSNAEPLEGDFNVVEGYFETAVPLASDVPFAYSLDLNAAVRVAHYNTAAGTQPTWKVGATWEPTEFLLLRVARSRDIRAPNIYELASGGQTTRQNILYKGISTQVTQVTGGNPDLDPEKSDTLTFGAVLRAPFLNDLTLSVDYYDVELKDAVSIINTAQLVDRCAAGDSFYCDLITFDSSGVPVSISNPYLNLNVLRREGIDAQLAYNMPLADMIAGAGGNLSILLTGNWTLKHGTDVGSALGFDNRVGDIQSGVPRFRGFANLGYELDRFAINTQVRVIGASKYNIDYVEGVNINENDIPAVAYVDLSMSYGITDEIEIFGVADNLLDKDPPLAPSTFGYPTQPAFFDMIGRTYRFGIRGRF